MANGHFPDLVFAFRQCSRAPQNGLDARLQLVHGKGLRHVVIGAHFEPLKGVLPLALGREKEDGHVAVQPADFFGTWNRP